MTDWKRIYNFKDHMLDISVGMWPSDKHVYFTLEGLEPADLIDQGIEFKMSIEGLERILREAKKVAYKRPYKWETKFLSTL